MTIRRLSDEECRHDYSPKLSTYTHPESLSPTLSIVRSHILFSAHQQFAAATTTHYSELIVSRNAVTKEYCWNVVTSEIQTGAIQNAKGHVAYFIIYGII